jgi:hypothetical protein
MSIIRERCCHFDAFGDAQDKLRANLCCLGSAFSEYSNYPCLIGESSYLLWQLISGCSQTSHH